MNKNNGNMNSQIDFSMYSLLLDHSSDPIFCFDRTGKYLYVNHAFALPLEKPPEYIIGKRVWDMFPGEAGDQRFSAIKYVFETGETKVIEVKVPTGSSSLYFVTTVKPIKSEDGNVEMVVCISKEITQRKLAEEALRESEERYRSVFNAKSDAIIIFDQETGEILDSNDYACSLYGYTQEEILELKAYDFQADTSESEHKEHEMHSIIPVIHHIKKDGTIFPVDISSCMLYLKGRKVSLNTVRDITERIKAEQEIIYLSYHDKLTGLYNRRFYEEEIKRLDTERNLPISIIIGDVNRLKLINDAFGHDKGDELLRKAAIAIKNACRADDIIARWGGDEFIVLLPKTKAEEVEVIIKRIKKLYRKEHVNSIELSISFGYNTKTNLNEDILKVLKSAEDHMYNNKKLENRGMRNDIIGTIINTLHEKSPREEQHSKRVSEICQIIGIEMGFTENLVGKLGIAGLLHDIGKIAIDEGTLNKKERLSESEWDEIRRHPDIGYRILSCSDEMNEIAEAISAHHERWDGRGYPKGIKNEKIPLLARIISIADSYDAMTSERPYRKALGEKITLDEIKRNAGLQFDPEITKIFIEKVLGKA